MDVHRKARRLMTSDLTDLHVNHSTTESKVFSYRLIWVDQRNSEISMKILHPATHLQISLRQFGYRRMQIRFEFMTSDLTDLSHADPKTNIIVGYLI